MPKNAWCWMGLGILGLAGLARGDEAPKGPTVEEWKKVQERLATLEKKLGEKDDQKPPTDKKTPGKPVESTYDEGFWFVGPDDKLRIGGSGQFDARFYEQGNPGDNTFQVRRARLYATGVLEENWGYMVMARWDRGSANLHWAWVESQHVPYARFRMGQFKEPYTVEGVNSDQHFDFNERSLWVSNLVQLEDIGIMLYGKCLDQRLEYALGAFNGRGKEKDDTNDDKEVVGQLTLAPWHNSDARSVKGLNLSFSGSHSHMEEDDLKSASYTTAAQTKFWTYASTVAATGSKDRASAELEWLIGPASIKGGVHEARLGDLQMAGMEESVTVDGWSVWGTWLLTGEDKPRNKAVVPKAAFDPKKGTWGAWELAARYEQFKADRELFKQGFLTGTNQADSTTVGLNWYMNRHMKTLLDFQTTQFRDSVTLNGSPVSHENTLTLRFQFDF